MVTLSEVSPTATVVVITILVILILASVASLFFPVERTVDKSNDSYEG